MDVVVLPGGRMFLDDAVRKALVQVEALEQRFQQLEARLAKLEGPCDKEALATQLKSQAAQVQGTKGDGGPYAPLRSDTKPLIDLAAFARRPQRQFRDRFLDRFRTGERCRDMPSAHVRAWPLSPLFDPRKARD